MYKKIASTSLVLAALLAINGCGGGGSTGDTEIDGIQLAKDTIQELRTQALSLVDYNDSGTDGYLDTEAISMGSALENCSIDVETSASAVGSIIGWSIEAMNNEGHSLTGVDPTREINCTVETNICTYSITDNEVDYTGTVTLPDMDDNTTLNNFDILHGEFHGTVPYGFESTDSQTFDLNITLTKTDVGADLLLANISVEHNETSAGISDMNVSTAYTDETNLTWVKLNEVTLNGTCSDYTVVGKLSLPSYVQNAEIANDNDGWIPNQLIFDGSLTNTDTNAQIAGMITVNWLNALLMTTEIEPVLSIAVDGSLAIPERPEMSLALTYNNESLTPEVDYHEFTSSYSYDDTQIDIEGILDKLGENGQVTIDANNGIEVLILIENGDIIEGNADDSTGSIVTYNGSVIGTLEYLESVIVIRYTDGSFESLP